MSMPIAFIIFSNPTNGTLAVRVTPINENVWANRDEVLLLSTESNINMISGGIQEIIVADNRRFVLNDGLGNADAETLLTIDSAGMTVGDIFQIRIDDNFNDTIEKLAFFLDSNGNKFMMGAGDTATFSYVSAFSVRLISAVQSGHITSALRKANAPSDTNAIATLLDFLTARAYNSKGSSEPIFDNGLVAGTYAFDYEDGNAHEVTFDATDCDISWDNLPASGTWGSIVLETTTGGTLPSTLGGSASPDWQVELLSMLTISSPQTFELWSRDGSTVRIQEFTYSGQ
jgi:hypothetical protein